MRVAVGDVSGDGFDDLITAAGPGGGPQVNIYLGLPRNRPVRGHGLAFPKPFESFYAFGPNEPNFTGGVTVASADLNGDGYADLIFGAGATGRCQEVSVFSGAQLFQSGAQPGADDGVLWPEQSELHRRRAASASPWVTTVPGILVPSSWSPPDRAAADRSRNMTLFCSLKPWGRRTRSSPFRSLRPRKRAACSSRSHEGPPRVFNGDAGDRTPPDHPVPSPESAGRAPDA